MIFLVQYKLKKKRVSYWKPCSTRCWKIIGVQNRFDCCFSTVLVLSLTFDILLHIKCETNRYENSC